MTPAARALEPQIASPAAARAIGVPASGQSGGRRQRLVEECSWLDVAVAVNARRFAGEVTYARSRAALVTAFEENPAPVLRAKRHDGWLRVRMLLRVLANAADHEVQRLRRGQMLVSVPHRVLAERIGVTSTKTVQRLLRVLEQAGHVACVREGSTDELRPAGQAEGGN